MTRKPSADPFAAILNHAADRLFLKSVWLGDALRKDGAGTLYTLSTTPESFGTVRPSLTADVRRANLQNLLTAARAYINAERKHRTHAVAQLDLALPEPKPQQ